MNSPVVLKPRLSEKAYALSEESNTYVFDVPVGSNKNSVAQAVEAQYKVNVSAVRLSGSPGKKQRSYKRSGRVVHKGQRANIRKAYVSLKKGDKLPFFAAAEAPTKEITKEPPKPKKEAKSEKRPGKTGPDTTQKSWMQRVRGDR